MKIKFIKAHKGLAKQVGDVSEFDEHLAAVLIVTGHAEEVKVPQTGGKKDAQDQN